MSLRLPRGPSSPNSAGRSNGLELLHLYSCSPSGLSASGKWFWWDGSGSNITITRGYFGIVCANTSQSRTSSPVPLDSIRKSSNFLCLVVESLNRRAPHHSALGPVHPLIHVHPRRLGSVTAHVHDAARGSAPDATTTSAASPCPQMPRMRHSVFIFPAVKHRKVPGVVLYETFSVDSPPTPHRDKTARKRKSHRSGAGTTTKLSSQRSPSCTVTTLVVKLTDVKYTSNRTL